MTLSQELQERGLVYQHSAEHFEDIFDASVKRTVYLGIDPTADAIHVGNLSVYILLNRLIEAGHEVILLLGGATALIGDPSGRDTERDFVDERVVRARSRKMKRNIKKLTPRGAIRFVNNIDWLENVSAIAFLRDVGKHFTVNAMIKKESVAKRMESEHGISYTEFSYALLQSYDFYHLNEKYGCDVQIGGSDQWGNITSGIDYVRRKNGKTVFGMTMPLVVNAATGKKFGKSMGNAVWLDAEKTSPYMFYQFWLNTDDRSVISYLKLFTFLSLEEIAEIDRTHSETPGDRTAQKRLAYEVTAFVHGTKTAENVSRVSRVLFGEVGLDELSATERRILSQDAPSYTVSENTNIVDVLVDTQLATSKREARTFVQEGAVTLNGEKISVVEHRVSRADTKDGLTLLRRGKKYVVVLRVR